MLIVVAFIVVLVLTLRQPVFQIKKLHVHKTDAVHERDIAETVQEVVSDSYPLWLPKDSWLLYPKKEIQKEIYDTFSKVKDVRLHLKRFSMLKVSVSEWQPTFLWCASIQKKASMHASATSSVAKHATASSFSVRVTKPDYEDCRFMAENGHVFSEAPIFSSGVYLAWYPITEELTNTLTHDSDRRIRYFEKIVPIIQELESEYNLSISSVGIAPHNDIALGVEEIKGRSTPNGTLLFNLDMNKQNIIDNFGILVSHNSFQEQLEDETRRLRYIDLRFEGQLLFRFE